MKSKTLTSSFDVIMKKSQFYDCANEPKMWNTWSKWHEQIGSNQFKLIYLEKKNNCVAFVSDKMKKKKMSDSFWRTNWSQIESIFRSWCFFSFFYPTHNTISTSTLNVIWKMFWFLFFALFFFCIFSFPFLFEFVSLSDSSVVFFCSFLLRQHKRCISTQLPHRRRRNENGWWCSTKD